MYSLEVIEESIRAMDTDWLIDRWERGLFSDESRPIAESELRRRGINLNEPMSDPDPLLNEPVSDFSLGDLPFWKRLFTFKGRASRLKFWIVVPAAWLSFEFFRVLIDVLFERVSYPLFLLSVLGPSVPIAWIHWATIVQRLHDRNKSGGFALLLFIPLLGQLWALIELGCFPGFPGANRFGRN